MTSDDKLTEIYLRARRKDAGIFDWSSAPWILITDIEDWNLKVLMCKKFYTLAESKNNLSEWQKPCMYRIDDSLFKYYTCLFCTDEKGLPFVWKVNKVDPNKQIHVGSQSNQIEQELFKELNGVSERAAFGYCDRDVINKCIPKQLYYIRKDALNNSIMGVSKADYTSHYPANLCGEMPDWHTQVQLKGTHKPSSAYPFAFYIKSGHSAEYGVYDTHNWENHPLRNNLFGDNYTYVEPKDDITILCRASKYTFDNVVKTLYDIKVQDGLIKGIPAKLVLNSAIGYKHLANSDSYRFDHIAAVVIARANNKMVQLYSDNVLMMVVDSVIYLGGPIGREDKILGELHQEIVNAEFRMRGINQYIFFSEGKCIDYAHSSLDDNIITDNIEDIDKWCRKKTTRLIK